MKNEKKIWLIKKQEIWDIERNSQKQEKGKENIRKKKERIKIKWRRNRNSHMETKNEVQGNLTANVRYKYSQPASQRIFSL